MSINLNNTKIRVNSPEESKKIQEKAFELGYQWCKPHYKNAAHTSKSYLYFNEYNYISYSNDTDDAFFTSFRCKEITLKDLFPEEYTETCEYAVCLNYDKNKYGTSHYCYKQYKKTDSLGTFFGMEGENIDIKRMRPATKEEIAEYERQGMAYDVRTILNVVEDESWCVQVTEENIEVVKKWWGDKTYGYTIGCFYGTNKKGKTCFSSNKIPKDTLTTKEFYEKIGHTEPEKPKLFPLIEDEDFKVGDEVKIVKAGECYSTHTSVFEEVGFKNVKVNSIKNIDKKGTIFHICKQNLSKTFLCLNFEDGSQCLIDKKGVEKVVKDKKLKVIEKHIADHRDMGTPVIHTSKDSGVSWVERLVEKKSKKLEEDSIAFINTGEQIDLPWDNGNEFTVTEQFMGLPVLKKKKPTSFKVVEIEDTNISLNFKFKNDEK